MLELSDAVRIGVAAAHQAAEYVLDNVVTDRNNPTPEEAEAVTAALCATAATVEFNVRVNLPPDAQEGVRAAIEALSRAMGRKVALLKTAANIANKKEEK
jgi:succinate dehydrogenase/fumarate reductase flavoprotein subunit